MPVPFTGVPGRLVLVPHVMGTWCHQLVLETQLKASPFVGYNNQFRKGDYLCSRAITAGN